ncbi:phage tail tube protein [Hansschlegelia zhihuaiae]|uniref:Uncharacterized protein n=1 Tax=Hansschlegelia zhihuaiae TaxID=405005 RepID=A0A4Q0MMQ1_9HYPH|nr:hypothetical protein [Hansschlegelia zhihuaiae]RXF75081.1 hypothetical protein EK403_03260 [Hansschlegelia zhihuaiae]
MPRYFRKLATLLKGETTYGVDSAPIAANALLMTNVSIEPFQGEEEARELYLPWLGHQGVLLVGNFAKVSGSIELAGSGAAGDAPAFGPALRACGLAEVISAGVKVDYLPVSSGYESASIYWNMDGVNHILLGARGNVQLATYTPKRIPRLQFEFWGLMGAIADVALPEVDHAGFQDPLPVSKDNSPVFSIHGTPCVAESFAFNLGNQVEPRLLIGRDTMEIVNRSATGTAVVEAVSVASKNWIGISKSHAKGAIAVQHGTVAGNICEISAPAVQIGRPTVGQTQGITNNSLPLMFTPDEGDDELTLTFR